MHLLDGQYFGIGLELNVLSLRIYSGALTALNHRTTAQ